LSGSSEDKTWFGLVAGWYLCCKPVGEADLGGFGTEVPQWGSWRVPSGVLGDEVPEKLNNFH